MNPRNEQNYVVDEVDFGAGPKMPFSGNLMIFAFLKLFGTVKSLRFSFRHLKPSVVRTVWWSEVLYSNLLYLCFFLV